MSVREQGSSSYTIVIAGVTAMLVGAIMLTFVIFPMVNGFRGSALWSAETTEGATLLTYVGGIWEFWGGVLLLGFLSYIWVSTRQ